MTSPLRTKIFLRQCPYVLIVVFYNYYGSFQAKKAAKAEKQATKEEIEQPERPSTPVPSPTILTVPTPPSRVEMSEDKPVVEDKENTPPVAETTEHEPTSKTETQDDSKPDSSCAKCLKRRLTDVQSPSNSSTSLRECSPNKRAKHDTDSNNNSDSEDVSSPSQCHEPMQTEQISNLVNRFNSGLSSLLGSSPSHVDNTDSLVSSCSTEISSFSESLGSRPVIALTV